jgi:IS30 family transposase
VSHETLYSFVYSDPEARELELWKRLRTSRKRRRKRGSRKFRERPYDPHRVGIAERPAYVEKRKEFGHFETDSVIFPKGKCVLSVQCERMTGLARLSKLADKSAPETASALRSLANEFDGLGKPVLSLTQDNGTENALHYELVRDHGVATYNADPYCSWQKGSVENLNSLIRQYLPRSVRLEDLTDDEIYAIQERLNDRPRKRLGWLSPNERFGLLTDSDFTVTELFP